MKLYQRPGCPMLVFATAETVIACIYSLVEGPTNAFLYWAISAQCSLILAYLIHVADEQKRGLILLWTLLRDAEKAQDEEGAE